jgi:hypothetical protein
MKERERERERGRKSEMNSSIKDINISHGMA